MKFAANPFHNFLARTLLAALLSFAPATNASALDGEIAEEDLALVNEISAHNSAIKTMIGRFIQVDTLGNQIEGIFYLDRPDKIRFRYNPPSKQEIISVGKGFYIVDRGDRTRIGYPQDKIPLRQFLTDEIDLLAANMTNLIVGEELVAITLTDDTQIGRIEVTLIFDKQSKELQQWTLTEPNGNELTFSIYAVEQNLEIPKSYFYIDPTFSTTEGS